MSTTAALVERHGIDVLAHLDRQVTIPVLSGLQRQGDVLVSRVTAKTKPATTPVPATGTPVVRGESGGNTHSVVAEGAVFCDVLAASASSLVVALLTVPEGSTAYLTHPEHGYAGIAPGTYRMLRQREQSDVIRVVAD